MANQEKKAKFPKWMVIAGAVVVLAVIGILVPKGENAPESETQAPQTEQQQSAAQATTLDELYADLQESIANTEVNSSARVDAIALYAKAAAETGNEDIGNEAVLFIANNYPNYYGSNEMMEKTMLSGFYLEYLGHSDRVTELGESTEQAVKYVYRGAETVEADATQENLDQLWEIIETSKLD